jgi:3-keto-5-aminohexanoate cleavage enzyme
MDPLIISCAVSGGYATRERAPHFPFDPEAIGRSAVEAWREGAAIVHIHARDDSGEHTGDLDAFRRTLDVIRSADCNVIVNLTTAYGAVPELTPGYDPATVTQMRSAPLSLQPEVASFDCGSVNSGDVVFENSPRFLKALAAAMQEHGVKPEIEVFDTGFIGTALTLADHGLLSAPLFFQLVLGVQGGAPATARALLHLVDSLPAGAPWSVCALGRDQVRLNAMAIAMGGHARTWLEDNLWFSKGVPASNPMLVERVRRISETLDRPVATPDDARRILGLTTSVDSVV